MRRRFGAQVDVIEGARGAFEVKVEGKLVFSKKASGRFPEPDEIFSHFRD